MKLEVGMWVRIKFASYEIITKVKELELYKGMELVTFANDGWCLECDYKDTIIKASHNIVDVLEVGDYVNYERIVEIQKGYVEYGCVRQTMFGDYSRPIIYIEDIKSVLTKEQYEQYATKVVE